MMLRLMVESVMEENEEVRDMARGCLRLRRCGRLLELPCVRDMMLLESEKKYLVKIAHIVNLFY